MVIQQPNYLCFVRTRTTMICVRRKIWSETEQITQPTGRGSCGGSCAKTRTRKTYVGVKRHSAQSACDWAPVSTGAPKHLQNVELMLLGKWEKRWNQFKPRQCREGLTSWWQVQGQLVHTWEFHCGINFKCMCLFYNLKIGDTLSENLDNQYIVFFADILISENTKIQLRHEKHKD